MNYKKSISFFLIILIAGLLTKSSSAGDKITLTLRQPPPNHLNMTDLWKLDINNSTKENITIFLEGYCSEEKDGMIVTGVSKIFVVKPGKSTYGYNDFKSGTVTWENKKYQKILIETGNAPSGIYTICVTAKYENGDIADNEKCIQQIIEITTEQQIILVTPDNKEKVDPESNITFTWVPLVPAPTEGYILNIVEIKGKQSPEDAMLNNTAWFSNKNMKSALLQYPIDAKQFEPKKEYAWQVMVKTEGKENEFVKSEVWIFSVGSKDVEKPPKEQVVNELKYFYQLTKEPTNNYIEVSNDTLNIQFINNYASSEHIIANIYDVENQTMLMSNVSNSIKDINGLNRISIILKKMSLRPGKHYLLIVSDSKNNYYINFKIVK